MAIPKLALIPAAQGTSLYSVLPANGVGDFTFTRGTVATRINSQGLIETVASGVSRLNYPLIDGVVNGCPSHLLEPSRTNLIQYSEDFSQSSWTRINASITSNAIISPNGTLSADLLLCNADIVGTNYVRQYKSITDTTHTLSFYAKANESSIVKIAEAAYTGQQLNFNLSNNTISGGGSQVSGTISDYVNGWKKITFTYIYTVGQTDSILNINSISAYIWGAQLEQGSYPTSYIPNYGTAAGVTRSAETANGSGDASTFNDSEGVLMAEISALSDDSSLRTITLGDGSSSNAVSFRYDNPNQITLYLNSGGVSQFSFAANVQTLSFNKCLIKYKANDFSAWINGFEIGVDTSGVTFPNNTLNRINFDIGYGVDDFYGNTKQIQYYDSALNDSDLETLTSWVSFTDMANGQLYTIE